MKEALIPIIETEAGIPVMEPQTQDPQATLEMLAKRAMEYDAGVRAGFQQQMGYAFLCGAALNQAKALLPHGQFGKWCDTNLPSLSNGSVHRYMSFTEALKLKYPTWDIWNSPLQLTEGSQPIPTEDLCKKASEAVREATDGKSLTQLYRDLGIIKQPKAPGGFRPPMGAVQAWLAEHHPNLIGKTYDELPADVQAEFKAMWTPPAPSAELIAEGHRNTVRKINDEIVRYVVVEQIYADCHRDDLEKLHSDLYDAWKLVGAALKSSQPVTPSKPVRKLSPEGKAAIASAAKARWQAARAAKSQPKAA